jgi:uncharacterized protein YjbI with pentapeptide repeats
MVQNLKPSGEKLVNSINESAQHIYSVTLAFLAVCVYVGIAVASTTHQVLLLGKRIGLPLFDVQIPLDYFFVLAPTLLVLLHLHLLILGYLLLCKIQAYVRDGNLPEEETDLVFSSLSLSIFLGHGHPWTIRLFLSVLLRAVRIMVPVCLLLATQVTFLPYHSVFITIWHKVLIFIDISLIWYFSFRTPDLKVSQAAVSGNFRPGFIHPAWTVKCLGILGTLAVLGFSIIVAGGRSEVHRSRSLETFLSELVPLDLSVVGRILVEEVPSGESMSPDNVKGAELAGRNLRGADFTDAVLVNADFRNAYLSDAVFTNADLRGAKFSSRVDLRRAHLDKANLDGVDLSQSDLRGADLRGAKLRGAHLGSALLTGADLSRASLHGADLRDADLRGIKLIEADAIAVDFSGAKVLGADFRNARLFLSRGLLLEGVDLSGAHLGSVEAQCGEGKLVSPNFSDLRLVDFQVPSEDTWTEIQEELSDKSDGSVYKDIVSKIKKRRKGKEKLCLVVLERLDLAPQEKLSSQINKAVLLYSSSQLLGPMIKWPTPSITLADYNTKLAEKLVADACGDRDFTEALVRDLSGELPPERSVLTSAIARKMLEPLPPGGKVCMSLQALSVDQKSAIERSAKKNPLRPGTSIAPSQKNNRSRPGPDEIFEDL